MQDQSYTITLPADHELSEKDVMRLIDIGFIASRVYDDIWKLVRDKEDNAPYDYPDQITRYVKFLKQHGDQLGRENTDLQAENARLRAALEQIHDNAAASDSIPTLDHAKWKLGVIADTARDALGGGA